MLFPRVLIFRCAFSKFQNLCPEVIVINIKDLVGEYFNTNRLTYIIMSTLQNFAGFAGSAIDYVSVGLFVGGVLPLPGLIFGAATGLAIASRGKLGYRIKLGSPHNMPRLATLATATAAVAAPTSVMLERQASAAMLAGDIEKAQRIEKGQQAMVMLTLSSLQIAGGAIGYRGAWAVARNMKWI